MMKAKTAFALLLCVCLLACADDRPVEETLPALPPLTLVAGLPEAGELNATWSPDSKWLAYMSNQSGSYNIWKKPVAGGDAIQLTQEGEGASCGNPSWSPDGSRISFSSDRDGRWHIWIMTPSGEDSHRVTSAADSIDIGGRGYHDWSPDGKWLAFHTNSGDIHVIPATGGTATPAITGEHRDILPVWSPDGQEIAFTSTRDGQMHIWIARVADGAQRQVTTNPGSGVPSWSPDGRWLAFMANWGAAWDIWAIPATGGEARRVTGIHDAYIPRWSPDGRSIAFHETQTDAVGELWTMPVDGGEPRRISTGVLAESRSAWSPDGTEVAFIHRVPGSEMEIWKVAASGGREAVPVTDGGQLDPWWPGISWSPDGKQLAYTSARSGIRDIWTISPTGGSEPNRVTLTDERKSHPTWSPDGSLIAYNSGGGLSTVPGSGGPSRSLLEWGTQWPAWSPDGKSIAFTTNRDRDGSKTEGKGHTWILDVESGAVEWLCEGRMASWTPDGERLCFIGGELRRDTDIWIIPATGGEPTLLARTPDVIEVTAVWSPDGEQILYTTGDNKPTSDIYIADVSGMFE